jgi:hypothetical protein
MTKELVWEGLKPKKYKFHLELGILCTSGGSFIGEDNSKSL